MRLRLRAVVSETDDSKSLVFDVPAELTGRMIYRPGQFLTLRVPLGGRHLPRCYSLASSPVADEPHRVTVKRVKDGRASNWICDNLAPGDEVEVLAPAGVFTPRSFDDDFLLFGGGSGITPLFSILRTILKVGAGRVCLVYANRDERSVIFKDELKALAAAHPARLQIIHWLDSVQGLPEVAQLAELARKWPQAQAFICGPTPFMDAATQALHGVGFPPDRVHVERFVSLPDEEDAVAVESTGEASIDVEVQLDGCVQIVRCAPDETLLDAMLRAGLKAPHSCKAGACASCMCTLESGEVQLRHNEVLDKSDLAQGWTLACQAEPRSAVVRVRFPD